VSGGSRPTRAPREDALNDAEDAVARRASLDYAPVLGPRQVVGGFALLAALVLIIRALLRGRRKD
jgi:hypothetical protein